ncbi:hypothetical protein KP509_1Z009700 [Ceratopteris richardii]|nr:hypothetical protein KP509_1Z009700 [Ceratopteris richardii]
MLSGSKKGFWADGSDESRKQQRSAEDGDEEGNGRWRSSSSPGCQTYGCSGSDKNESARIYGSGSTSTSQRTALVSVIPEDVFVFKILPLLPLLQIFKLRCVCRSWYALLPRVLFGSKVDFADAKEAPWLVFARVIRSHYKPKDFTRELLAYIPASGRWFSFPLPFQSSPPSSSSSSEGWGSEARLHNSSTHYDISSLLGPGLQNTHPCYQRRTTVSTHPLMASARGLVCTLVYNKNVFVDAQRLPLPSPRSGAFTRRFYLNEFGPFTDKASAFHWASLLLFNPLTGKALVEPLPPDPILSRVPLALSIVQAYEDEHHNSATSDRNSRYYVVLCPVATVFGVIDARAGMWIYDLHRRSWKQNIATLGFRPYKCLGRFEFDVDLKFDTASIHSADGNQYDILRDADILTYEVLTYGADHVMPYISGPKILWCGKMVPLAEFSWPPASGHALRAFKVLTTLFTSLEPHPHAQASMYMSSSTYRSIM